MSRRWITRGWKTSRALACGFAFGCAWLAQACTPSGSEPRDATSVSPESAPASESTGETWASSETAPTSEPSPPPELASPPESPSASDGSAGGEPWPSESTPAAPPQREPAGESAASGQDMVDFFEMGRGDRVADLGGLSGYSLTPIRRAVGPSGIVYVRRRSPPPTDSAEASSDDLGKVVWMNTPEEAPLTAEATRLNAVTLLFAYHAVVAAGRDRQKLNGAVFRALLPGGVYIIADNAAPPGSGIAAARELNRIEESVIRQEVQAAGFEFVAAGNFVTSAAAALRRPPSSQYVLKFRKR